MVFRYAGNDPKLHFRAIRLNKNVLAQPFSVDQTKVVTVSHVYTKHVISPLLGAEYVDSGVVAWMRLSTAISLVHAATNLRLPSRLLVHPLEQMQMVGEETEIPVLLMDDMGHLKEGVPHYPTFSLEIKPKWGFLPHSPFIDEKNSVKRSVCRYCMMQLHKAKNNDGAMASRFCPLDIYSGNKARVCRAICHLIKNPQNNFRVAWKDTRVHQALPGSKTDFEEALRVLFQKPGSDIRDLLGPFVELVATLLLNPFTSKLMVGCYS